MSTSADERFDTDGRYSLRAVDVHGFAGGFTLGVVQAGWELAAKCETIAMKGFGVPQCEANRRLLGDKWEAQVANPEDWQPVQAEMVFSNPPCSGFSILTKNQFRGEDAKVNQCMYDAVRYAAKMKPEIYIMESVRAAFKQGISMMRKIRVELEALTGLKYLMYHVIQDNYSLGGASKRPRYFLVLSRVPFGVDVPELTRLPVLGDAIGDLQKQPLSWSTNDYVAPPTWWSEPLRADGGTDGHDVPDGSMSSRILDLLEHAEWHEGEAEAAVARRYHENVGHLPLSWQNKIRQDKRTHAQWVYDKDFDLGMFQVPRWCWDKPARVVTGAGPWISLHPREPRYFTHREVARIMGFPDDWKIEPLRDEKTLTSGWGKGVSVNPGRWVATWAKKSLEGTPGAYPTTLVSDHIKDEINIDDEWVIDVSKHWKTAPNADAVVVRNKRKAVEETAEQAVA